MKFGHTTFCKVSASGYRRDLFSPVFCIYGHLKAVENKGFILLVFATEIF